MKAFLVTYDFRELHKKSEIKIVKYGYVSGYVRGCPKQSTTQIWSLGILRVKGPTCKDESAMSTPHLPTNSTLQDIASNAFHASQGSVIKRSQGA
jgi:hypothetical protein